MPVGFDDVRRAAETLSGIAHRTPVLTSRSLNHAFGSEIFFKCENFQRMGAFKFRGAYHAMSSLTPRERSRGVITHSSGNHAQAVALSGQLLGIATTIVMPEDAPAVKREATEGYGGRIVSYDPANDTRERISHQLAEEHGYVLIPPFDHPHIVAGQGTAATELHQEVPRLNLVLAPCGGGGLLSGTAVATRSMNAECRVAGVEPEVADDAARSFRSGRIETIHNPPTIADGTRTASLSELTFELIRKHVDDIVTVSEAAIADAVRRLFVRMKIVVEPSGALGLAALATYPELRGGRVGIILSGGNVDELTMAAILRRELP